MSTLRLKYFLLIFAYVLMLAHTIVPHHHHALTEDQATVEHHPHTGDHHHHDHHTDKSQDEPADDKTSEAPFSHIFNPVESNVFLDNENNISVVNESQADNDLTITPVIPAFLMLDDWSNDMVVLPDEPIYFDSHSDAIGLRAPPINFLL